MTLVIPPFHTYALLCTTSVASQFSMCVVENVITLLYDWIVFLDY